MAKNLFFDLEAGGLLGSNSSILSIAYGDKSNVQDMYASPTEGSRVYYWSEKNVWEPIASKFGHRIENERDILSKFIKQLEQADTISGWNIGYSAQPVKHKEDLRGFDLSMLATRARKYEGLSEKLHLALKGKQIRDVGQEYAVITARTILQNQGSVDESIYEQAIGFEKKVAEHGVSLSDTQAAARIASTNQIRFAGWKQELMFETMFDEKMKGAHEAVEDVRGGLRLADLSEADIEKRLTQRIGFWNRQTYYNKLISSAKAGVGSEKQFETVEELIKGSKKYGLEGDFRAGIKKLAADYGASEADILAGKGIGVEGWNIFKSGRFAPPSEKIFQNLPSKMFAALKTNKGQAALYGGAIALTLLKPGRLFSGKDDNYNTIEGLRHDGIGWQMRQALTDFGSGYQGSENSDDTLLSALSLAAGGGLGYLAVYPWAFKDKNLEPRLRRLRQTGREHGFRMYSTNLPQYVTERTSVKDLIKAGQVNELYGKLLWEELDPSDSLYRAADNFEGVLYVQSGSFADKAKPTSPLVANWGSWEVGSDKTSTWRFFQNKEISDLHASSLEAEDFYTPDKKAISPAGQEFLDSTGGLKNVVVKKREAARGTGVWLSAAELPGEVSEDLFRNPQSYLLQEKLDLAEEFRVVTVGDTPVHTTYRFGSPTLRKWAKKLGFKPMKEVVEKNKLQTSPFEVIEPVWDTKIRERLESFATKVSKELPYDIGALDIGMTKSGDFKLIEAQRSFGNISNPIVSRRIKNIITGSPGSLGVVAPLLGAGIAYGAYSLFSGKDDEYNTIEGLQENGISGQLRKINTDFGSGYRGLTTLPKSLQVLAESLSGYTGSVSETALMFGKLIKSSKGGIREKTRQTKDLFQFLKELRKGPTKNPIWINPLGVRRATESLGGLYTESQVLKGVIKHERLHQRLTDEDLRGGLSRLESIVPQEFKHFYKTNQLGRPEMMVEEYLAYSKSFRGSNVPQVTRELFRPAHNLFSGKDDAWNTIEGLMHKGEAAKLRKILTDFGSGWDAVRGLMRASETFSEMLAGKEFQAALRNATVIGEIGSGKYATVHKMRGVLKRDGIEKEFFFARKQALPGQKLSQREADILSELQQSGYHNSPSFYGYNQATQTMDMELFSGKALLDMKHSAIPSKLDAAEEALRKLHSHNIEHTDAHIGNIMEVTTPAGKKEIGVVDYGFARRLSEMEPEEWANYGSRDIIFMRAFASKHMRGKLFHESYGDAFKVVQKAEFNARPNPDAVDAEVENAFSDFMSPVNLDKATKRAESTYHVMQQQNHIKHKQAAAHNEGVRLASKMGKNSGQQNKAKGSIASKGSMFNK